MIRNLFNLITAWASVVLLVLVVIIWILRILVQKNIVSKDSFVFKLNRTLRKHHKATGIAFLVVAFVHGLLSSAQVFSFNWGSISFFFILIMSLSYLVKKHFQRKTWVNMHRILTVLVVLTFAIHIDEVGISGLGLLQVPAAQDEYQLSQDEIDDLQEEINEDAGNGNGNQNQNQNGQSDSSTETATPSDGIVYNDGVYTGVADGFGPNLTVEVTIKDNLITDVVVVSHNEVNERFWGTPVEEIPPAIVEAQSIEVDSISGATYTSAGIKNAVLDALNKALVSGDLPEAVAVSGGKRH